MTHLQKTAEEDTIPDRQRWKENELLFQGVMDWGAENDSEDWQSRIFIHEFAPIIREAALEMVNTLFENSDWVRLVPLDDSIKDIAAIREKLLRYYFEEMKLTQKFTEFVLAGGIYGVATFKESITRKVSWKPEVVIEKLDKQLDKEYSRVQADNTKKTYMMPGSMEEIEAGIEEALDKMLGKRTSGAIYERPTIRSKKRLETCIDLRLVNPFNFFTHPDCEDINESPYTIERIYSKFFEVDRFFKSGMFDKAKRDDFFKAAPRRVGSIGASSYEDQKWRQKGQFQNHSKYLPQCELLEYFGPIIDENGEVDESQGNAHVIIGNGKFLLKNGTNGYWDQKPPYISSVFSRQPFKNSGQGIADGAVETQKTINHLMSLFVDQLKMDIFAPKTVNMDQIMDPSQIANGLKPGIMIKTFNGSARDAISDLPRNTDSAPVLFQSIEALKLAGQKASNINTMSSNPASRSRITGTEVRSNESRRAGSINSLAIEIDNTCVIPLVKRTDSLILQFGFSNDNLELLSSKGVLTESEYAAISNMSSLERFASANKHYKVEIKGFRVAMERDRYLSRAVEWISQLNQMPPEAQQLLDWNKIARDITEKYGFDADKWLRQNTPMDKAREENFFLQGGQQLSLGPEDQDLQELPVHYELLLKTGPMPNVVAHVMAHIQRLQQSGQQFPTPPPEVAEMLGLQFQDPRAQQQESKTREAETRRGSPFANVETLVQ